MRHFRSPRLSHLLCFALNPRFACFILERHGSLLAITIYMSEENELPVPGGNHNPNQASLRDPVTEAARDADSRAAGQSDDESAHVPTRRKRDVIKAAAGRVVNKVRPHPFAEEDKPLLNEVRHDAAFNPSKVAKELEMHREADTDPQARNGSVINDAARVVAHPKKAIKRKIKKVAAGQFISGQEPLTSRAEELRFLDANAAPQAQTSGESGGQSCQDSSHAKPHGQVLEDRRDSLRAAWSTSHLRRVRVVSKHTGRFPSREAFTLRDEEGRKINFDWLQWIGHLILYYTHDFSAKYIDDHDELPFDIDTTRVYVERLITGSGQWQAWLMDVRSVYRWEDRTRTAKWYALYLVLWYTSRIMTFFWAYVLYHVLSNRSWSHSVQQVQAAAKRALDRESTAFQIGELIDRHGSEDWLDPLIQEVGPFVQLQLGDMANLLEVLQNFYAWTAPSKTAATLFFFTACLMTSLFADMEFCMKIVWFVAGNSFFLCWPVASRYPRYRLLVSPFKWVLWSIPTHSELSFQYLRNHAQLSREEMIKREVEATYDSEITEPLLPSYAGRFDMPDPGNDVDGAVMAEPGSSSEYDSDDDWHSVASVESPLSANDILSFRAHWKHITGRLCLSATGMRFMRNLPRREMWNLPYAELQEMRKAGIEGRRKLTLGGLFDSGVLEFQSSSGEVLTLDPIKYRDEAFNCVIGFSGLQWQALQTEPGKGRKAPREKGGKREKSQ